MDPTLAEGACVPQQKVLFTLKKTDDFGFRHEWVHHKEFFENAEYGLELLNDTLGCPGARITKTYIKKQGDVEINILIHNTQKNAACVLREFDDHYEIVSVHELHDPYYPDNEAKILQIARKKKKNSDSSLAQAGIPTYRSDKININPKTKKSSRKRKKDAK